MSSKRKEVYWSVDSSPDANLGALTNDKPPSVSTNTQPSSRVKKKTSRRSTLKTLCAEDKHKVRLLIEDLAKAGAEKDAIELLLKKERSEFDEKLSHLHLEQQSLLEERRRLERSLQESELKLQTIRSQQNQAKQDIPVHRSAPVASHLQWSHDHSAPPTKFINMDCGLNYPLGGDVIIRQSSSSTVSSLSSVSSPLHLSDITAAPQPLPTVSQATSSSKKSPLVSSKPHPPLAYCNNCTDRSTQTAVHTGVQTEELYHTDVQTEHYCTDVQTECYRSGIQTEHYHPIPAQPSQQTVTSLATSSQEYNKMEQLMATALLNAKDTINTIETLSQSLLLRNVSREVSLATIPPESYTQHVTYPQDVAKKPAVNAITVQDVANNSALVNVTCSQDVANNSTVVNAQSVTYSQDVANKPVVMTITQDQAANSQEDTHLQNTVMTTPTSSHVNHMATPPQHNYMLYNDVTHHTEDDTYRDDELQLEDLAATLNSTMAPSSWHHSNYFDDISFIMPTTPRKARHSNVTMTTQPVGKHLIGQTDSEILKDLFFIN